MIDGSAVKTTKVMASAVAVIGWGAIKFKAGYETAGALEDLHDSLKWPLEYFINIWSPETQSLVQRASYTKILSLDSIRSAVKPVLKTTSE